MLQAPSRLSPDRHPEAAAARARIVLSARWPSSAIITQDEAKAAAIDPNTRIRTRVAGAEYYVADWVETLMQAYIGDVKQDVVVTTTIDWDLQKQAEFLDQGNGRQERRRRTISARGRWSPWTPTAPSGPWSAVPITSKSQYNRAVTARRQPGSAFKPFVYVTAMEHGYTPDSVVDDAPFTYKGWSPENYNHKYAGPVRLRDALAHSLNTVSARLAVAVGPQNGGRHGPALRHFLARSSRCPRSRSARRRSRCSN